MLLRPAVITFLDGFIPKDVECRRTIGGHEYRGTETVTMLGRTCQRWDSQEPHDHSIVHPKQIGTDHEYLFDEMNYCRNPLHSLIRPWCFTKDINVLFGLCDIPMCGKYWHRYTMYLYS